MSPQKPIKVYITKWALTEGITEKQAVQETLCSPSGIRIIDQPYRVIYLYKPHWHLSEKEAAEQVMKMIARKRMELISRNRRLDDLIIEMTTLIHGKVG